ncbi:hypothetical protein C488_19652 [Natrinema pellirubrum DSM 15624]|uniref:Uncharacterized protein n=1 Tax=Natrinema pellirubrum (strain DSM 15624 / CIP 106293 / JCM 10476 / NCIMB 786 / 157) TaxID=797303 RepID=L0JGX5_NATP1|nr:hypothetical protein [Natrinema pellirubrum]AGB30113.1 hypothetical protein Natpe_0171 [Natrinema pellirubrum DSM 15624]ELY69817.1 hypothetical protein C488_19652 [Natrinema pellirubrum DSM 15624]
MGKTGITKRLLLFAAVPGILALLLVPLVTGVVEGWVDLRFTIYIAVGSALGMGLFMLGVAILAPETFENISLV